MAAQKPIIQRPNAVANMLWLGVAASNRYISPIAVAEGRSQQSVCEWSRGAPKSVEGYVPSRPEMVNVGKMTTRKSRRQTSQVR